MPMLLSLALALGLVAAPQLQKEQIAGVRNYTKVDATIGCAGATDPKAMAAIAGYGYAAVLNLRDAGEEGAQIPESRAAAQAAGLTFINLPFSGSSPDPAVADQFLKIVTDPDHHPLFINCGSANRVGALWLIKRMLVDRWDEARAVEEAKAIGLSGEALQQWALEYVARRR